MTIVRIISGGQWGADMGALEAARECGMKTGGWAPRGWLTERGHQRERLMGFGLTEHHGGYGERTDANVHDSDGTLLIGDTTSPGSKRLMIAIKRGDKPLYIVRELTPEAIAEHAPKIREWAEREDVWILNVAGNRESRNPGIQNWTGTLITAVLNPDWQRDAVTCVEVPE